MVELSEPALIAALAAAVLAAAGELLHSRRLRVVARLAFGPRGGPRPWVRSAPVLRIAAMAALAWGLITLTAVEPQRYEGGHQLKANRDPKHVLLVLDVSPSMRLVDAGPSRKQSRSERARDVLWSFFSRVPIEEYRVSVVAVYNGAKPVVVDTRDFEVVRNILGDLPMHFAFAAGKTKLFDGLEEAARIARPWNPKSTTLIVVSDGDTVPATGMPRMPDSVAGVLVVGVGDPLVGKFIDGKQSRQDVPVLRQIAARLSGSYHNGNEKHLGTSLIAEVTGTEDQSVLERLTLREYALIACALGAGLLALMPVLLHGLGSGFDPGPRAERARRWVFPGWPRRYDVARPMIAKEAP
ncbi:MAG: vWA domain-containing protein [Planctomycetota bacterium]